MRSVTVDHRENGKHVFDRFRKKAAEVFHLRDAVDSYLELILPASQEVVPVGKGDAYFEFSVWELVKNPASDPMNEFILVEPQPLAGSYLQNIGDLADADSKERDRQNHKSIICYGEGRRQEDTACKGKDNPKDNGPGRKHELAFHAISF